MSQYPGADFYAGGDEPMTPPRTSLLCAIGFGSSVFLCCPLTSLVGLVLGFSGIASVSLSGGRRKGMGFGIAAVLVSVLGLSAQSFVMWQGWPWITDYFGAVFEMVAGPQPFIENAQKNDIAAARECLFSTANAAASDEMIEEFIAQVTDRYGALVEWAPPPDPGFQSQGPGTYPHDLQGQGTFEKGNWSVSYRYTLTIDNKQRIPQRGIEAIIILDHERGDLIFDPAGVLPQSQEKNTNTQRDVKPPETLDDGG